MRKFLFNCFFFIIFIHSSKGEKLKKFPSKFKFGSATSSYQIEGAWNEYGKSSNVWDNFVHSYPDRIKGNATGDIAADSYHRFDEDLKAIKELGLDFYRFSISWSRILPNGDLTNINEPGIKYYNMVINKLLENGVLPMVTMSHFDTPQIIEDMGGFINSSIIEKFTTYADVLFKYFGDRVKYWITFNEAYEFCLLSYGVGLMPPLIKDSGISEYKCMENTLKAHAKVYQLFKSKYKHLNGKISLCLQSRYFYSDHKNITDLGMNYQFGILAQPVYSKHGGYPDSILKHLKQQAIEKKLNGPSLVQLDPEWLEIIKGSADFLGLNYYTAAFLIPTNNTTHLFVPEGYDMYFDSSWKKSVFDYNWDTPKGLEDLLKWIRENYGDIEIIITECGWGDKGEINDVDRIEYLRGHLNAVLNAINDGSNITGFTAWSLIDNFEWIHGYDYKYGLYQIDFNNINRPRIQKESAKFYKIFIENMKSNANSVKTTIESIFVIVLLLIIALSITIE